MFRSVFSRLAAVFVLIIVVSFSLIAILVVSITGNYAKNVKINSVKKTSEKIAAYADVLFAEDKNLSDDVLALFSDSSEEGVSAFLCYENGAVRLAHTSLGLTVENKTLSATVREAANAETYAAFTDLDGLLPVRCAVAVSVVGERGEYVVAFSENTVETAMLSSVIRTLVLSTMWVLIATLIAIFFVSERTVGQLKTMSRAAKRFAAGQLDVRVPVVGNDEIAELSAAFNSMAESLANAEKMRSSFLGNVSHDLRTPMTTISGFIDGILDGTIAPADEEHYLRIVSAEVKRLSRLVGALLDISRLQAGERKFHPEDFDLCEMARQILLSFEQLIEDKKLEVDFDVARDSMTVYADRDAIHQVLYNIVDNAVKFSRPGGLLRLRVTQEDKKLRVSVYNEGDGIPSEDLPFVFDRFYKSDKSRSLDRTGIGLGLYISRSIIEAHGGAISVTSEQGKNCEFTFTVRAGKEQKRAAGETGEK